MAIYEIGNPSDAYTIKGELLPCAAATIGLGVGHYGLTDEKGEIVLPVFAFAREPEKALDDWMAGHGAPEGFGLYVETHRAEVADALDAVVIGKHRDRLEFEDAISVMNSEQAAEFEAKRHDLRRSSMNDIGARAKRLAHWLREPVVEKQAEQG